MRVGTTFPRDGLNHDAVAMRDFAQAAEALGHEYVSSGDHVIGRAGLEDSARPLIDPFVLLGHLAAVTSKIGLVAGIMVLPQRQTVLVAKQAASLDVLSSGRLQLNLMFCIRHFYHEVVMARLDSEQPYHLVDHN